MMLLSELARREGLFDWLAARATEHARGSPSRLFALIYGTGILVTVFLSNDATAIVLTPAVYAATRVAKVDNPLPYLLICAFIANAASFVLPISNPANLVVYGGGHMPPLAEWTALFLIPSLAAIVATYVALWLTQRNAIACDTVAQDVPHRELSHSAKLAGIGIAMTAVILLFASLQNLDLGFCTFVTGGVTAATILALDRESPISALKHISWSVLPLVAGLFVLVEALNWTGVVGLLSEELKRAAEWSTGGAAVGSGVIVAIVSNLLNNLPTGLVAGSAVQDAGVPHSVTGAVLIGVDLGPNLSVTGSLATILWLSALRREGLSFSAWKFLKVGLVVMPPALVLSLASLLLLSR
jgi:arsenical pump membrane protein